MTEILVPLLIAYAVSFFISLFTALFLWARRRVPGAFALSILAFAQASWTFGTIAETALPGIETKIFWDNFQFFGWIAATLAIIPFVLDYGASKNRPRTGLWVTLLSIAAIVTTLAYTDPWHRLIRPQEELVNAGGVTALTYPFSTVMWALTIATFLIFPIIVGILVWRMIVGRETRRLQTTFIILGLLIPVVGGVLGLTSIFPAYLRDTSPFTFGLGNLIITFALIQFRIFELLPIAREKILDEIDSAILLITTNEKLNYANKKGVELFTLPENFEGDPLPTALMPYLQQKNVSDAPTIIEISRELQTSYFEMQTHPITSRSGRTMGNIIILNDITGIKQAESALTQRTNDLESRTAMLEMATLQIENRATQLQTIADVTNAIAQVQDLNTLLPSFAQLMSERFGYYHVGIYLADANSEYLYLRAASNESGQALMKRGFSLPISASSIVGYVAQTGRPRIALNMENESAYAHPDELAATHSQIALPLTRKQETIGVLNVESEQTNAFNTEDIELLSILASQVSIAIQNARLFEETQKSLREAEETYRQFIRQEWRDLMTNQGSTNLGYTLSQSEIRPLRQRIESPEITQTLKHGKPAINTSGGKATIPLILRGETLGVLDINTEGRPLISDEVEVIQAVADRLTIALENVRLLQESQRRAIKEQTIGEMSAKIGSSINLGTILQTAVKELGNIIPGSEISIQLKASEKTPASEQ